MTILELREKRAKAWEAAKPFWIPTGMKKVCCLRRMTPPIPAWSRRLRIWEKRSPGWSGRKPLRGSCPSR